MEALGSPVLYDSGITNSGSTDMGMSMPLAWLQTTFCDTGEQIPKLTKNCASGNVTYTCPGFHGGFAIPADPGAFNHTPSFTSAAGTSTAHELAIITAKGMAIPGSNILSNDNVAVSVRKDFEEDKQVREGLSYGGNCSKICRRT